MSFAWNISFSSPYLSEVKVYQIVSSLLNIQNSPNSASIIKSSNFVLTWTDCSLNIIIVANVSEFEMISWTKKVIQILPIYCHSIITYLLSFNYYLCSVIQLFSSVIQLLPIFCHSIITYILSFNYFLLSFNNYLSSGIQLLPIFCHSIITFCISTSTLCKTVHNCTIGLKCSMILVFFFAISVLLFWKRGKARNPYRNHITIREFELNWGFSPPSSQTFCLQENIKFHTTDWKGSSLLRWF